MSASKRRYGLLGRTLAHSYSVPVHNLLGDYTYELFNVEPGDIENFLKLPNFDGINVTIPYKKTVIPYCTTLDDTARRVGSVNTLVVSKDGSLHGSNTDYYGFGYMVKRAGIFFEGKKVIILGSGGTCLTATAYAEDHGAREIVVVSRSGAVNYTNISAYSDADIIVNTTPVGMFPANRGKPIELREFPNCSGVIDAIYNPLYTRLLLDALALGIPCTNGLPMLVAQAKLASEMFTGTPIEDSKTDFIVSSLTKDLCNIVLIGMPGSGKTSIGAAVAKKTGRTFVDTDSLIVERAGMSIPDIFSQSGEAEFRRLEAEVISETGKITGAVIATGGGSILSHENYLNLKQNAFVIHLARDTSKLATGGRPLSADPDKLEKLYKERAPLYKKYGDVEIRNDLSVSDSVESLLEAFYETSRY